jgi:hypothetical protein
MINSSLPGDSQPCYSLINRLFCSPDFRQNPFKNHLIRQFARFFTSS